MGQKTHPNILRLGFTKNYKHRYIEKKSSEIPKYSFNSLEIEKFIYRFFKARKLYVTNCKISYAQDERLNIFISYYVAPFLSILVFPKKSHRINIKNKKKRKKVKKFSVLARNKIIKKFESIKELKDIKPLKPKSSKKRLKTEKKPNFWSPFNKIFENEKKLQTVKKKPKLKKARKKLRLKTIKKLRWLKAAKNNLRLRAIKKKLSLKPVSKKLKIIKKLNLVKKKLKIIKKLNLIKKKLKTITKLSLVKKKFKTITKLSLVKKKLKPIKKSKLSLVKKKLKPIKKLNLSLVKKKLKPIKKSKLSLVKKKLKPIKKLKLSLVKKKKLQATKMLNLSLVKKKLQNIKKRKTAFFKHKLITFHRRFLKFKRLFRLAKKKKRFYNWNQRKHGRYFINLLCEGISKFLNKKVKISLTLKQLNKERKFNESQKETKFFEICSAKLNRYREREFFDEGVNLLYTCSKKPNYAVLIAEFLANHLKQKDLKRHVYFFYFVKNCLDKFKKHPDSKIKGIKIQIKGRINRRPRARCRVFIIGKKIPNLSIKSKIDYFEKVAFTPNGTMGIKVWAF